MFERIVIIMFTMSYVLMLTFSRVTLHGNYKVINICRYRFVIYSCKYMYIIYFMAEGPAQKASLLKKNYSSKATITINTVNGTICVY